MADATLPTVVAVPTLSAGGWVTRLSEKMDFLLAYLFESDGAESYSCPGGTTSVQAIIARTGNDPLLCSETLRSALEAYFTAYYPQGAMVQVSSNAFDPSNMGSRYTLSITITVTEAGKNYTAGKLVETLDGKFSRVTDLANNGDSK